MLLSYSQPISVSIIDFPSFSAVSFAWSSPGDNSKIGKRFEEKKRTGNFSISRDVHFCEPSLQINSSFRLIFLI
jgi:hypothetical protein